MNESPAPVARAPTRWWNYIPEAPILFPAIALLMLGVIWGMTLNLVAVERSAAEHNAAASTSELAETYEAQVVRALREIDRDLKLVKYAYEFRGLTAVLDELKARTLLLPDLLFVVTLVDSNGKVLASTRPTEPRSVAGHDYFEAQRVRDQLAVGLPQQVAGPDEWQLIFSHRLDARNGGFAGIVMLSVSAAYFVSSYESTRLGERGVLALLGADGVFRTIRSGESVSAGGKVDYASMLAGSGTTEGGAPLRTNAWDGVRRYTSAHPLYDFPLAVIVGLSAEEQLAKLRNSRIAYLWRASAASVLLILVLSALGWMSHQLALSRRLAAKEQRAHAARVEYLAYHDALTGLPNRSLFSQLLAQCISQARRHHRQLAVLFLDLDRFKDVNDSLGHDAGDYLLQEVAKRLKGCLRESDTVARLGGDEFVVLLPELDVEKYASTVAQKVLTAIALPFVLHGEEFRVTASLGISTYPEDGLDEQTLTKNADIAMYNAKGDGKNTFRFHSAKMNTSSIERLTLESSLRHALEHDEFQLHYQAKCEVRSGRITGVEALLRWEHPDLGTLAPMRFIPVAEETGLIVPIGKWVLRTACQQNIAWQAQGLAPVIMAVNLTQRQFFDESLLTDIAGILAAAGMDASLLELEITEGLLMRDVGRTIRTLTGLKALGVRIAIDDFGIGYSSLATLKEFPLDTIKIDRSFIRNVANVADHKDLTAAITALGRALSLTVVAQGVETKEQADFLRQNPCDEFQGFYLNKPLPPGEVAALLHTHALGIEAVPALD